MALYEDIFLKEFQCYPFYNISNEGICALILGFTFRRLVWLDVILNWNWCCVENTLHCIPSCTLLLIKYLIDWLIFFFFSVHNWYNHGRSTNKSFSLNTVKPYMRRGALLLGTCKLLVATCLYLVRILDPSFDLEGLSRKMGLKPSSSECVKFYSMSGQTSYRYILRNSTVLFKLKKEKSWVEFFWLAIWRGLHLCRCE